MKLPVLKVFNFIVALVPLYLPATNLPRAPSDTLLPSCANSTIHCFNFTVSLLERREERQGRLKVLENFLPVWLKPVVVGAAVVAGGAVVVVAGAEVSMQLAVHLAPDPPLLLLFERKRTLRVRPLTVTSGEFSSQNLRYAWFIFFRFFCHLKMRGICEKDFVAFCFVAPI